MGTMIAAVLVLLPVAAASVCTDAMDCSLNGDCVGGVCHCDSGWGSSSGGPPCSELQFGAVDEARPGYFNETADTWGGSPVYWAADGKWHVFTAMFANGCNVDSWLTNSYVFHAVGDSPNGPWVGSDVSINIFAHNPQPVLHPDGTWLLYFIGGWHYPLNTRQNCTAASGTWPPAADGPGMGATTDGCGPAANKGCGVRYASSKSPYGPWTLHNIVVTNEGASKDFDCAKTNPAPYVLNNGSVLLAVNGGYCHDHMETIGIMIADTWSSPFRFVTGNPIANISGCGQRLAEDPTIWKSARGYHLLAHAQCSAFALYAFSRDAVDWTVSRSSSTGLPVNAYSRTVTWRNGTQTTFQRMERPIVVLSPTDGLPFMLTNAVLLGNRSWGLYRSIPSAPLTGA